MFKKVDRIVLKSFLGPLLITFLITDFIFLLQFLWKYIDDLVGKGLETSLILQLTSLYALTIVPLALPLAVLLSSTMVLGNMGEHNELVSFKSSGVSLLRIMQKLIFFVILLSIGAYFFSNKVLPATHLKFYSLLYDIRKHKPALDIKEGVFYNGIEGYTLRIMKKAPDDKRIFDITVYDHTEGKGNTNVTLADKGELIASADGQYLIMTLYNGKQYREMKQRSDSEEKLYERSEMTFSRWRKVFDLASFEIKRTDEALFKDHYHMLNAQQLSDQIDTLYKQRKVRTDRLKKYNAAYVSIHKTDESKKDDRPHVKHSTDNRGRISANTFLEEMKNRQNADRAINRAETMRDYSKTTMKDLKIKDYVITRHQMEWNRKFTLSAACIILLFIGGPMGAIVRKGGFGMPILISVLFFLLFHVLTITGEKLAKEGVLKAASGMWLPSMVLAMVGIFLTYKAVLDAPIMREEWYSKVKLGFKSIFRKEKP